MGAGRAHGPMGPWAEPWVKKKLRAALGPGPGPARNLFFGPGLSPWAHGSMGPWARPAPMISLLFLIFLYVCIFSPIYFPM